MKDVSMTIEEYLNIQIADVLNVRTGRDTHLRLVISRYIYPSTIYKRDLYAHHTYGISKNAYNAIDGSNLEEASHVAPDTY